jgi:KDO2-lipid IV(A) lauroyltransferase
MRAARAFGAFLGWKAYRIFRVRRGVAIDNIRRALPEVPDDREADRIACLSYQNLGRTAVEFVSFDRYDDARVREMVEIDTVEPFDQVMEAGRGGIVLTAHIGCWELLAAAIFAYGYPLRILVGRQSNPLVDRLINDLRQSRILGIIPREMGLKLAFRALANNQFVGIAGDQDARGNGVFVDFLGRPASTARGPALFAIRRNAAIVPCFIHRVGPGKHLLETKPPMWPDPSLDEDAAVFDLTQRYMHHLADAIKRNPTEYLWGHRRWKHQKT